MKGLDYRPGRLGLAIVVALALVALAACQGAPASPTVAPTKAPPAPTTQPASQPTAAPAQPAATPQPPAPQPAATAQPAAAQPITLRFNAYTAPDHSWKYGWEWWGQQVTEKTNGRVKVQFFYGGALGAATEQVKNLGGGVFDLAPITSAYHPGELPLLQIMFVPGLPVDTIAFGKTFNDLSETPAIQDELKKLNIRWLLAAPSFPWELVSKPPIKSVADMKGLKIRAIGQYQPLVAALSATPVFYPFPEVFENLQRGNIDAAVSPLPDAASVGLDGAAKNFITTGFGGAGGFVGINLDTWNKLPADVQKVMLEVRDGVPAVYAKSYSEDWAKAQPGLKQKGVVFSELPQQEKDVIAKAAATVRDKWAGDLDAKGLPGRKVLDALLAGLNKYKP